MDPVNTMKYDELTLMQFADGELDESLTAEIEAARIHDKELQSYLEVYETTRSALISVHENEEIPSHINHLIDNFVPEKKQNCKKSYLVISFLKSSTTKSEFTLFLCDNK